ncbi:hypothetical protein NDN08_003252 [Rhodosorus marinus]|uniref:Protein FAM136A n=1 Tax=Rhodosorus marinus TaxID=101924 RepID=A0AAV8UW67_9RHOD|nr:hypothetical protein NDN08_003252 [Rhodosorus marinus]
MVNRTDEFFAAVTKEIEGLEMNHVIPMQKKAFLCSADCCDGKTTRAEVVGKCVDNCQRPLQFIQQTVNSAVQQLSNKFSACEAQCQDKANYIAEDRSQKAARRFYDRCVSDCAESCEKHLPEMVEHLRTAVGEAEPL